MDKVRLFISVASVRDWKSQFGASVAGLLCHIINNKLDGRLESFDFKPMIQASNLSEARERGLLKAIEGGFTHILYLDDDMVFPNDTVDRLLAHDKDIVVCNYRRKCFDIKGVCCDENANTIDSTDKYGIDKAGFVALGVGLIKLENVKKTDTPHFEVVWCNETKTYWSEDMVFSAKMRQAGIDLWIDHSLSHEIQHIGDCAFQFPNKKA